MHIYVILTTILCSLGAIVSLFQLKLIPLICYTFLAIMGICLISDGYMQPNTYIILSFIFFLISFIWEWNNNNTLELVSLVFGIWSLCLLFTL